MIKFCNLLCCLAIVIASTNSFAQNISVDPLTGQAIINIPIGGISAYDLSASVSLSHHGGAIKAFESPGNAGIGWNVSMGGSLWREVRGLPDDYNKVGDNRKGWLHSGISDDIQVFSPYNNNDLVSYTAQEANNWLFLSNTVGFLKDSEPDIYYFSAPGISGKFVYDHLGQIRLFPYQDLVVTSKVNGFTIKTKTGIVYEFDTEEILTREAITEDSETIVRFFKNDYELYKDPLTFTNAWHLTSIKSNVTGAIANFTYVSGNEFIGGYSEAGDELDGQRTIEIIKPNYTNKADRVYSIKDIRKPKLLSEISITSYRISFTWANSLIQKISISELESQDVQSFTFTYSSIYNALQAYRVAGERILPFLVSVNQENSCIAQPPFRFSYNGVNLGSNGRGEMMMAWSNGWGEDIYGYFNGLSYLNSSNPSLKCIPQIYVYQTESGANRFRTSLKPNASLTATLIGGNKSVDSTYVQHGALESITYPSGGTTFIKYENSTYVDPATNIEVLGPGIRVKSISTPSGELAHGKLTAGYGHSSLTKSYGYFNSILDSTSSGKILYPPVFAFTQGDSLFRTQSDMGPGSMVLYKTVIEKIWNQGYRVYEFDLPNMFPELTATESKVARPNNNMVGFFKNGAYTFPFGPLTDLTYTRGMLKRVSEYSEEGNLTQQRRMSYQIAQSPQTVKGLRFEAIANTAGEDTYFFSLYQIPVGQSKLLVSETVKTIGDLSPSDSIKTITSYTYNPINRVTSTNVKQENGPELTTYFKYAKDFVLTNPSAADIQATALYKLNTTNRDAELIETYQKIKPYLGTEKVVSANLTVFKDYGSFVWPYQNKELSTSATFLPSSVTTGSNQLFSHDPKYIVSSTIEFSNGYPVNQTDASQITASTHYATNASLPMASFINCKAEHAVYDGFEFSGTRAFEILTGPTFSTGWTGKRALSFPTTLTLTKSVVKAENSYRVSCWVKAAQSSIISINATGGGSTSLTYSTPNTWTYLEGTIDITSAPSTFSILVTTNQTILIDDFLFMPSSARVSLQTQLPLTGVTSTTDDRGNSIVVEYDQNGRKTGVFDKDRNLVERTEYGTRSQPVIQLNAAFTVDAIRPTAGEPIIFSAIQYSCVPSASYEWTFTDHSGAVTTAAGTSVTKSFPVHGGYIIELTVSAPGYSEDSFTDYLCIYPPQNTGVLISVINAEGGTTAPDKVFECNLNNDEDKIFTPTITGLKEGSTFVPQVNWEIWDPVTSQWIGANYNDVDTLNRLHYHSPQYDYTVRCVVSSPGFNGIDRIGCGDISQLATGTRIIDFVNESQCQ